MRVSGLLRSLGGLTGIMMSLVLAVVACQPSPTEPDQTSGLAWPVRTVISVDTLRLAPVGTTGTLTARLYDANGSELTDRKVKWWTSSITAATLSLQTCGFPCTVEVTSKALGTVKVIAYWYGGPSGAIRDTAWVVVTATPPPAPPPPVPPTLLVTPASVTLAAGATQLFSAVERTSDGDRPADGVTWAATGGTISNTGLYTAGADGGSYSVTATLGSLTASATVTVTSQLPPSPPPGAFIGPDVAGLPMSGAAWTRVLAAADAQWTAPDLCNQDNKADVEALAGALVYARTGISTYKTKVISAIQSAMATQRDGCFQAVLALGRQLGGWVLAADYVGYRDPEFVAWVTQLRTREIGGHGRWHQLRFTAGNSSNNWGIWALASVIAADRYLDDRAALDQDWAIFKGYGDGSWTFQTTSDYLAGWNCGRYRAIEDLHCGDPDHNGVPAEDASRSGTTTTPDGGYVTEAISGYTVQAMLLSAAGYDSWGVNDQQPRRVADFMVRFNIWNYHSVGYYAAWVLNRVYGTAYPALSGNGGRMFAYTDWLFGS